MDGLIVGTSKVTPQIIDCMENLKCIVKFGTGTDNIDIEYARSKGIVVKNLPAVNSASVAEFTVGMIFAVARRIPQGYANLQRGRFYKEIGTQVIGKLVGIVGTGNIGKQVAMMCKGLGLNVHVYDLYPDKEWANANGLKYVT
ncbi:MAG: NAD(P)-dependent oxidoreductase, partial [Eubacteriales bacterium]